eukprot:352277-Chlamydomonas_euryale.AAC.3
MLAWGAVSMRHIVLNAGVGKEQLVSVVKLSSNRVTRNFLARSELLGARLPSGDLVVFRAEREGGNGLKQSAYVFDRLNGGGWSR